MTFKLARLSDIAGSTFFKPADHLTDVALLVEPKRVEHGVENSYNGETRLRDEVFADVTVFATVDAVETGTPTETIENARIVHGMLTEALGQIVGGAVVAVVRKVPTRKGSGFAFRPVDPQIESAVLAYGQAREATLAEATADMPSFD